MRSHQPSAYDNYTVDITHTQPPSVEWYIALMNDIFGYNSWVEVSGSKDGKYDTLDVTTIRKKDENGSPLQKYKQGTIHAFCESIDGSDVVGFFNVTAR